MTEPRRLVDDPATPPEVREALEAERVFEAPYDVDAGLARLDAALEALPSAVASTASGWTLASKLGLLLSVAGLVAVGVRFGGDSPPHPGPTAPVVERASTTEPAMEPTPEPTSEFTAETTTETTETTTEEEVPPSAEAEPTPSTPRRTTTSSRRSRPNLEAEPTPEAVLDPQLLRREVALVAAARGALESSPARALELVRTATREIPNGVLAEERLAIEVLALDGVGRRDEARTLARRFLRRHPRSGLADRVREVLVE